MNIRTEKFNAEHLRRLKVASAAERDHALQVLIAADGVPQGHLIRLTDQLSPAAMFKYLLARFADPVGTINDLSLNPISGVAWHYLLTLDGLPIEITGYNFRIDVVLHRDLALECSPGEFASLIKGDLAARHQQVVPALHKLRKWTTFLNPYSHLLDTAERMLERAKWIDDVLEKSRRHPSTVEELKWQLANHGPACALASELAGITLAVRMIAPVMAETFVNLILFQFVKPGYRDKSLHREKIVDRIRQLDRHCDGFFCPVDIKHPAFVAFHQMMEKRNNLLHGNIQPESQPESEVVFAYRHLNGATIPVFQHWKSIYDRSVGSRLAAHPLSAARDDLAAALQFVQYLLSCLEPSVAQEFQRTLTFVNLQYDKKERLLAALFTDDFADTLTPELFKGMGGGDAPFIAQ